MSEFSQQQPNFFDESYGQVVNIPSQPHIEEDTHQFLTLDAEPHDAIRQTIREHNAPKIIISLVYKILYWKQDITTSLFRQLLSEANLRKNRSALLKLIYLARKAGLIANLKSEFPSKAEQKLHQLRFTNQWTESRFNQTNQWKERFESALNCRNDEQSFEIIWRGHNHQGKHDRSSNSVKEFQNKLKKIKKCQLKRIK